MDIQELIKKISSDRKTPGRFPVRLIFIRNFDDYISIVDELKTVCDEVTDIADYTRGDIFPNFKDLKKYLSTCEEKQILLLSIGEYLRICLQNERNKDMAVLPAFWEQQQSESSITKYIVPIFGSREVFDSIIPKPDERQDRFIWEVVDSPFEPERNLTIYSPDFTGIVSFDANDLHEWLQKWTTLFGDKNRYSFSLRTKLYRYSEPVYGGIRLSIISEPYKYIVSLVSDGDRLDKSYGSDEFWKYIARHVKKGYTFAETIKELLNIRSAFDPINALVRTGENKDYKLCLLFIWYKLYPSNDYYTYAINKAPNASAIPVYLRDSIFELSNLTDAFIQQRIDILRVLPDSYSDEYFAKIEKISMPETRLKMLTYKTFSERAYAIKTVSTLLRKGTDIITVANMIKKDFPLLAEYLAPENEIPNDISSQYFNWYRCSKIVNCPNIDVPYSIDYDTIDSRNKIIQQNVTADNCYVFWVDGLGIEWIHVLLKCIKERIYHISTDISIHPYISTAILPTETEYNHFWSSKDEKWDKLDKLAHNGMPDDKDYYRCITKQLEIIEEIAERASELLKTYDRIIITGDHGSSRLAALLFHDKKNYAIRPPKDSVVHSFGRYIELKNAASVSITPSMYRYDINDKHFIIMKTYEHFTQSGNAAGGNSDNCAIAGEIHGGMTPEEYLVPVVVISRKVSTSLKEMPKKQNGISNNDDMGL